MTYQINIFLLLFGSLQGGLLSLWFLKNQSKKLSNTYFALLLIVIGLQLTFKVITKGWLMENVHFAYWMSYKLPYLVGPILFLYVKARKKNKFLKRDLVHFIPFTFFAIYAAVAFMMPWLFKYQLHPYTHSALQIMSLVTYGYFSMRLNPPLKIFINLIVLIESIIAITLAVMVLYYGRFPDVRLMFLLLTVLIYWISYKAVSKPEMFLETSPTPVVSLELRKTEKYAHSSLKREEATRIETDLAQLMKTEKPFLDSNLTIDVLAAKLKTSRHHLSQVLNEKINKSYVDYICDLRLEESKIRLSTPSNNRFTIAAIALDSGFNSVSSFNEVFKKRYGITPSKFRNQHLDQMSA
jgi:AraC-like DNA-binding protein